MKKSLIKKYASLVVRGGANVQKGQPVVISAEADRHEFVTLLVDEAYKAGASRVTVEWDCQQITKLHYRHASVRTLSEVPLWQEEKQKEINRTLPATIRVLSEDPDGLAGINKDKLQKVTQNRFNVLKKYHDERDNKYQWTIVGVPSPKWAKKVFPGMRTTAAVEKLWEAILSSARVTEDNDPADEWRAHNEMFLEKSKWLNEKKFDYLHYKSANGTDFKCWLIPQARWHGGADTTISGIIFNPNIPTEEIYISPMKGKCEGRLISTKPLSNRGQLIDGFWIEFKDGKAVSWDAKVGKEALESIITTDEGSAMLGELALVPHRSPISDSGVLFYNTLYDENASCHVALGRGFNNTLEGYESMTFDECKQAGINDSIMHVDFMIGSSDMSITGYKNGKATPIFVNGNWA